MNLTETIDIEEKIMETIIPTRGEIIILWNSGRRESIKFDLNKGGIIPKKYDKLYSEYSQFPTCKEVKIRKH